MAVVQRDPLAEIRRFVKEKPEELKASVEAWCRKQPAWVEGVAVGVQGSFQVGAGGGGRGKAGQRCRWLAVVRLHA